MEKRVSLYSRAIRAVILSQSHLPFLTYYVFSDDTCSICLMDLQMPVMDGFNATSAIRVIEKERMAATSLGEFSGRLKVYALSGLASPEDKERAATIGFDG
jgi:CheY-like chemotaxis protein